MHNPHSSESDNSGNQSRHFRMLGVIAVVYAVVVGPLLGSLLLATAVYEGVPLARVIGLGCYGIAAVGALLQIAIAIGLWRDAGWLGSLVRGTSTAIIVPLILAAALFVVLPLPTDVNHSLWSVVAAVVGLPWPIYLNSVMRRCR